METSQIVPLCHWKRLSPELVRKVADGLHPNDAAASLKLADSDTAAALRGGNYSLITLGQKRKEGDPHLAQMPWPGREFVLQWGRPEPWRKLPLPQRERLLCLAASSGHVPSLEASLQHGGCALKAEVLQSAAGSGNLAGCKRLIDEGCSFSEGAVAAAAQGGHLVVLQLLLEVAGRRLAPQCITAAAHAACLGNQRPVLEWLESAHGYRPGAVDVQLAAWAGHVALMEQMMPLSPEYTPGEVEDGYSGMEARRRLLMAIADGCPVEVLRRHFRKLWYSYSEQQRRQAEDAEAGTDPEAGADAEEAVPLAAAFEEEEEDEDAKARRAIGIAYGLGFRPGDPGMSLLSTVISSATPCWPSKLRFLLSASAWGPELARAHIRGVCEGSWANVILGGAAEQPDFLQRLKRLRVAGMRLDREIARAAVATAARHGHADALVYLWDECGVSPDPRYAMTKVREGSGTPRHVAVLQLLRDRGAVITARDLSRVDYGRWPEAVVLELIREAADRVSSRRGGAAAGEAADEETSMSADEAKGLWTFAFAQAARSGASQRVLAALRGRGAAIDLGAVAVGGGEEALTWAATELQAERGADESKPAAVAKREAALVYKGGNVAALRWLNERGLLWQPPPDDPNLRLEWPPSIGSLCNHQLRADCYWQVQVWGQVELDRRRWQELQNAQPANGQHGAAAAQTTAAVPVSGFWPGLDSLPSQSNAQTPQPSALQPEVVWAEALAEVARVTRDNVVRNSVAGDTADRYFCDQSQLRNILALPHQHHWLARQVV